MGVCCIVFDIDGMLFEFIMNFLNIEKKIRIFYFQHLKKKLVYKKFGGGVSNFFFLEIHFAFYAIFNIKKKIEILKSAPSLTG